jgi:hypothetical protein
MAKKGMKLAIRDERIKIIKNKYAIKNYIIMGSFDGIGNLMRSHIMTKCMICGHTWESNPDHIINGGRGCPLCGRKKTGEINRKLLLKKSLDDFNKYGNFAEYRKFVRTYTYQSMKMFNPFNNIKTGTGKNSNHIDHIRSVYDCFRDRIAPEIVGSCVNLQLLTWLENQSKYIKSWQTKEELVQKYEEWLKTHSLYSELINDLPKYKFTSMLQ